MSRANIKTSKNNWLFARCKVLPGSTCRSAQLLWQKLPAKPLARLNGGGSFCCLAATGNPVGERRQVFPGLFHEMLTINSVCMGGVFGAGARLDGADDVAGFE
jgi:hypothetical protein